MSDYIPTTAVVRYAYACSDKFYMPEKRHEFNRWLAEVKAQAVNDFIREQNAEYRKTLGTIMYSVIDEV